MLLIAIPFIGAALIPLVGHFFPKARAWFAVACAALSAAIIISMIPDVWNIIDIGYAPTYTLLWNDAIGLNLTFYVDALGLLLALVATIIGLLVAIYSVKYMETDEKKYNLSRYYSLVILFIGAMVCLVLTDNLLVLYFFWEIVGLCSYALIGYYYDDPKAAKAGMKAFVTTRVGDTFLLIGIIVLYWQTKTFSIQGIISAVGNGSISVSSLALPGACFILGAIGKSAQVPLHVWLPDAMEAPTPISALIHAATMVNAGIYLILRVMPIFSEVQYWLLAVGIIGGVTMLMTAIQALVEIDLKRLLAYSTISQLAYLMLAASFGVTYGLFSSSFHLLVHGTFKALLLLQKHDGHGGIEEQDALYFLDDDVRCFCPSWHTTIRWILE
jgi:NADH-quinone oxidoreductase subunit L